MLIYPVAACCTDEKIALMQPVFYLCVRYGRGNSRELNEATVREGKRIADAERGSSRGWWAIVEAASCGREEDALIAGFCLW